MGGACIGTCAVLAYFGRDIEALRGSPGVFLAYWGIVGLLFCVSLFCVALDIRYIRMARAIEEREIFRQTIGEESFRKALREAQQRARQQGSDHDE
ncbi:MAG: hypothetical protein AMXMBFR4_31540 [Candidatus Hydrogenedentota bacterium]